MAVISDDTFDPLRRYVRVRLQQGVPIVDADVNEREDIQKFELRAFLKWFVGDGVPEGNGGFRIVGTGSPNDFEIRAGFDGAPDALHRIGRCLVQGMDVMIEQDVHFAAQPLHESQGESAVQLAAHLRVPMIGRLESITDPVILVYLDVWERLVTPAEDPRLVSVGLGTESCARYKREWVVRARAGTRVPKADEDDFDPAHAYTPLATIKRREGDPLVQPSDVTDGRERRLLVPPATLVEDVLGTDPAEYRRGRGRPPISLRDAVNALLRGELPATPDAPVAASVTPQVPTRAFLNDGSNGLLAFWSGQQTGGQDQIFATRMDLADVRGGFAAPRPITTGGSRTKPHAVLLPGGDLLVAYQSGLVGSADVYMKRAPFGALAGEDVHEISVAATAGVGEGAPFLALTGALVTVLLHQSTTKRWQYRRWQHTSSTWVDTAGPIELSVAPASTPDLHAAVDPTGRLWVAFLTGPGIRALRLDPATGVVDHEETFGSGSVMAAQAPFVLCNRSGDVWVSWSSATQLHARRFRNGAWEQDETIPMPAGGAFGPCAVEDADGATWLFCGRGNVGSADLVVMRRDPVSEVWGPLRQLVTSPGDDSAPFALVAPDNALWIFWASDRAGVTNVYYKRLVTAV
ncbi:DUF6519 domain-containing protein [Kitasatospora sp. NPDC047058]|uniref:DUF6519 domain-containing protein n=1 Tax=Kitasatospora sp. NPDC047058 TaxID=3155620 RepID=UPI0033CA9AB2